MDWLPTRLWNDQPGCRFYRHLEGDGDARMPDRVKKRTLSGGGPVRSGSQRCARDWVSGRIHSRASHLVPLPPPPRERVREASARERKSIGGARKLTLAEAASSRGNSGRPAVALLRGV